jgi:DNA-binding CsgD family transcriptional regulator
MNDVVERESEIHVLDRSLRDLGHGRGGTVVVEAGAGLGKTTLLRHVRARARESGFDLLDARGADMERDFTFGAVRQLFEPALHRRGIGLGALPPGVAGIARDESAPQFPEAAGIGPAGERRAPGALYPILNGFYRLLADWSAEVPLVVTVDDAQWLDVPSLRFLAFLSRRLDTIAVALVIACRSGESSGGTALDDVLAAGDAATLLRPRALSRGAVGSLVRSAMGPDADDEFCDACHAVTAGNPLFVKELLRALLDDRVRPNAAGALAVKAAGPGAVRRHVVARLRGLPAQARQVARATAVLGDGTAVSLVARLTGLSTAETAAAAESLTAQGIFESALPPAFVHAVVRDVVLGQIPAAARSCEHERAAAVVQEAGEPVERTASHLLHTDPAGDAGRVAVLLAAADEARKRGAPESAAVYLLRARNEPPPREARSEISRLLGNCRAYRLELDEAQLHLDEAVTLADAPVQRALSAYSLARFRSACGAADDAVRLLTDAAHWLEQADDRTLADELEAELIGHLRSTFDGRPQLLERLEAFRSRPGTSAAIVDTQLSVEAVFGGGPAPEAAALARRALADGRLTPDRSAIWGALHILMIAERLEEAEQHLHRVLATALRRGLLFPLALARGYLARIAFLRGDLARAREHVALGAEGLRRPHFALPVLHAAQIELLIEDDELDRAEVVLQDGVLAHGAMPDNSFHLWLLGARTRLRLAQGRFEAALLDAHACRQLYERWGAPDFPDVPWRLYAAEALDALGEGAEAAEYVDGQLSLAERFGSRRLVAGALRTAGKIAARPEEAVRLSGEAAEVFRGCDARLETARALEQLGELLVDQGRRPAGLEALAQAADLAAQCNAAGMADRVASTATHAGPRRERRLSRGLHAFTPSERRIARMVADGLTNREIADQLFLSQKTVEAHLSRAYRKLGVSSRTQLALRLSTAPTV